MHRFKELNVWKESTGFAVHIYKTTAVFPNDERFGLMSQLRRAAVSIPSNIAEGASRSSNKEFARFIEIALGSAYEIETQLLISLELNFIDKTIYKELNNNLTSIIKMLSKLKSSLQKA